MSRFGSTAEFFYDTGDVLSGGTTITLNEQDMPQFPVEDQRNTDEVLLTAKSGHTYEYRNYNKASYIFNWSNLAESKRNELATMADAIPILSFRSGGNTFGTFRMVPDSWSSVEISHELYDVSFLVTEDV